jgi:L-ascorbate metabolism protein UlaG (beta-lactamase superfamily)
MKFTLAAMFMLCFAFAAFAQENFEKDVIKTTGGDLEITFIGHASLMLKFDGKIIHVDPFSKLADYAKLPTADAILITHEHQDHLDTVAIRQIRTKDTVLVLTAAAAEKVPGGIIMKNGEVRSILGIRVEAVPAYNLVQKRENGQPYHTQGQGNGYLLTVGSTRIYIAGDTENTPEMKALKNIDYAFLPMNLPYTMTPEMVADAVKAFRPRVLYPYHFGDTDTTRLVELLKNDSAIEVRIRKMK